MEEYAWGLVDKFSDELKLRHYPFVSTDMDNWMHMAESLSHLLPVNQNGTTYVNELPVDFMGFTIVKSEANVGSYSVDYLKLTRGDDKALIIHWGKRFFDVERTIHTTSRKFIDEAIIAGMLQKSS